MHKSTGLQYTFRINPSDVEHVKTCQRRAQVLFKEGCYQGDIAREEDIHALDEESVEVLNAINETVLSLVHNGINPHDVAAIK